MPARAVWWIELIIRAVEGDAEAVSALVAASTERNRRMTENGHFARTAVQIAELAPTLRLRRCGSHSRWHRADPRATGLSLESYGPRRVEWRLSLAC
jgi:hypothetical protein